jgi:outer membrane protein assembly factor BamB
LGALLAQGFDLWTADPAAWNTPNGLRLIVAEGAGRALAFHPTQAEVALQLGADLYLLETETGRVRGVFPLDPEPTCAGLAYTPEGTLFFADCTGLYRLDATGGPRLLSAFAGQAISGLLAGASASLLGVLTDEGLALVASADGASLQSLAGVSAALFSPDGRLLAVQMTEGVVVWGVQAE